MFDNLSGQTLQNRYILERKIGTGGMGTVYQAHDQAQDHAVAIKFILPALALSLRREYTIMASLNHPHIVKAYAMEQYQTDEGMVPYVVMQLAKGDNLATKLERGGLPLTEVNRILSQLCAGLDYAHSQRFVHRDIKPANILFDEHDNVLIADFGLTKILSESRQSGTNSAVQGTPNYWSPEQSFGTPGLDRITAATDVFSLGVMLHQMLLGHIATWRPQPFEVYIDTQLKPPLYRVVNRAMQREPRQRYQSAGELYRAFQDAIEVLPEVAAPNPVAAAIVRPAQTGNIGIAAGASTAVSDRTATPRVTPPLSISPLIKFVLLSAPLDRVIQLVVGGIVMVAFIVWRIAWFKSSGIPTTFPFPLFFALILTVVFLSWLHILWQASREWLTDYYLRRYSAQTKGRIVEKRRRQSQYEKTPFFFHHLVYEYEVNGEPYQHEQRVNPDLYRRMHEGYQVTVGYLPSVPRVARISGQDTDQTYRNRLVIQAVSVAVTMIIFGIIALTFGPRVFPSLFTFTPATTAGEPHCNSDGSIRLYYNDGNSSIFGCADAAQWAAQIKELDGQNWDPYTGHYISTPTP